MLPNPVSYVIHDNGTHPSIPPGKAYAYVFAGNGLFKAARNRHVDARIKIASCRVAGLHPIADYIRLQHKIPGHILDYILEDARATSWGSPCEAMYHIVVENGVVRLLRPGQIATAAHLAYKGGDNPNIVVEIHSHQEMDPFFSTTDNRDEQGFRFYGVIGRIFSRPEIRLRLGMYGDFTKVSVNLLFTNPGPFQEAASERA
jgi:PRTRC genetic system protein A